MKTKLTNNLGLKIVSVLVAILIWLFASNASDPVDTKPYTVRVEVVNDSYILDSGRTYQIEDADRTATVYVTGRTSVINGRNDITVQADMTQIVEMNENADTVYVPLSFKPVSGIPIEDVDIYPKTIPVSIEDVEDKEFVITVNTSGKPGNGYEIGEAVPSTENVRIRGPKSVISKIKSVVANVAVEDGITEDVWQKVKLSVMDQNGDPLTGDLESLQAFGIGEDWTVSVNVKLWRIVDDVKINTNYSGTPAQGYQVEKITTTPETISVAGSEEALQWLKENNNTIEIPANLIEVDGISRDLEANIKLNSLLKEEDGFKVPEDMTQSVLVRVSILPVGSKEYELETGNIAIKGLGKDLRLAFDQSKITVRVKQVGSGVEELDASKIKASLDLTDKVAGEYTLPVMVTLPEGYEQVENTIATVQLTKIDNTEE